jgi:hypothetical protein
MHLNCIQQDLTNPKKNVTVTSLKIHRNVILLICGFLCEKPHSLRVPTFLQIMTLCDNYLYNIL